MKNGLGFEMAILVRIICYDQLQEITIIFYILMLKSTKSRRPKQLWSLIVKASK